MSLCVAWELLSLPEGDPSWKEDGGASGLQGLRKTSFPIALGLQPGAAGGRAGWHGQGPAKVTREEVGTERKRE